MKRPGAVGVTGTPGTGKKSVSPILSSLLGRPLVEINAVARARFAPNEEGELEVDVKALGADLAKIASGAVVSGHLLSDVLGPAGIEFVAVLRCEPMVLKRRLASRGYAPEKITENCEAELIGVVLDAALRRFGPAKVHEYDSTRAKPAVLARKIARDYRSGSAQSSPWIDWTVGYDSSTKLTSLLSRSRTEPAST